MVSLPACASEEVKTEPDAAPVTVTETVGAESTTEEATDEETTTEEADPPAPDVAGIGDSISLAGFESGYRVKLVRVKDNPPHDQYFGPERGMRFYAVYLRVTVTDGSAVEVCASNDSEVVDSRDQTYTGDLFDTAEPSFGCPRIGVVDARAGWVTFQVPKRAKLVTIAYTPGSGFADESGEWELR